MKKNGFTLIELLAVIIILAIVALIATPIILDVVEDAKKSAAKSEAQMIVSGINNYCATAEMKAQLDDTYTDICDDGVTAAEVATMVNLGNATVSDVEFSNGAVTAITIVSNGYTVGMDGTSVGEPTKGGASTGA